MRGDAADLVKRSGGGVICDPEDPEAIFKAVEGLSALSDSERRDMGRRGQDYYRSNMSFRHGVDRYIEVFSSGTQTARDGGTSG